MIVISASSGDKVGKGVAVGRIGLGVGVIACVGITGVIITIDVGVSVLTGSKVISIVLEGAGKVVSTGRFVAKGMGLQPGMISPSRKTTTIRYLSFFTRKIILYTPYLLR
jgi:hypothetical protein